jgi:hypothetical protein
VWATIGRGHILEVAQHEGLPIQIGQPRDAFASLFGKELPIQQFVGP